MRGAVAGGHPETVAAGRYALERGGGAIDAAIAAQLTACVAEPLLTGPGGGGVGLVRTSANAETRALDFFSPMPSIPASGAPPLEEILVDFRVTTQRFLFGPGSVAIPGLLAGLEALHQAGARLPLTELAAPAVKLARQGLPISEGLSRSIELLAPIVARDPYLAPKFLDAGGAPLPVGSHYALPELGESLELFGREGASPFYRGGPAQMILDTLGERSLISADALAAYRPYWRTPLRGHYRGAQILSAPLPSHGGAQLLRTLRTLEAAGPISPDPLGHAGPETLRRIYEAMRDTEDAKEEPWPGSLGTDPMPWVNGGGAGFTTHLAASDEAGGLVALTSSLGETAGRSVASLGIALNNFLGEEDVAPPQCLPAAGDRLFTMCTPTFLIEEGGGSVAFGSGGSSRIRSAILHGIVYRMDHQLSLQQLADAPRAHWECDGLRVEAYRRPEGALTPLRRALGEQLIAFEEESIFFGGLHSVATHPLPDGSWRCEGAGDARRSGAVATSP